MDNAFHVSFNLVCWHFTEDIALIVMGNVGLYLALLVNTLSPWAIIVWLAVQNLFTNKLSHLIFFKSLIEGGGLF